MPIARQVRIRAAKETLGDVSPDTLGDAGPFCGLPRLETLLEEACCPANAMRSLLLAKTGAVNGTVCQP
jgi:hypothetical protein